MITIPERYTQTDRQTDGRTTYDLNTALCTKVHRAVKIDRGLKASDDFLGATKLQSALGTDNLGYRPLAWPPTTLL